MEASAKGLSNQHMGKWCKQGMMEFGLEIWNQTSVKHLKLSSIFE